MKRSDSFYWSNDMSKKSFIWNSDNFNNPIRIRNDLAKFNKVRPSNVSILEIAKIFLIGLFK